MPLTTEYDQHVLACVDRSPYADCVADYAAWAAQRMEASLELLHVIDRHLETTSHSDRSGAIGFDAQEHLLEDLSQEEGARTRALREEGRLFLNALRERARAAGVAHPDIRQRYGELGETLEELEPSVDLFVCGRRGEAAAHTQRDLGRNVERVVRRLHRPILTVTEDFKAPTRALFAFDGSAVTRRGVALIAGSRLFRDLPVDLVLAGKPSADRRRQLETAVETLSKAGKDVTASELPGDPERVIATAVRDRDIDLLVMGAYGHSPLRSLLFGSKTSDLLRSASVPTLLLR